MPHRPRFRGCFTALVTPFDTEGRVDFQNLDRLVDGQLAAGVEGLVPLGTTGECATLAEEERGAIVRRVVERAAGRAMVMAGCGSNSTEHAIRLTRQALDCGADATLQVVPYYNKPSQEGLYRHFETIARATRLPLVLYNVPSRTGVNLSPATIERLAKLETVLAVKEASGSLDQVSEILERCEIDVLSGDDTLTLPILALGGTGVVSVASNIVPGDVVALVRSFEEGRIAEARAWHRRLFPLAKALFLESNPVPVKTALALLGRSNGLLRPPLAPLEEGNAERLRAALLRYGLLVPSG